MKDWLIDFITQDWQKKLFSILLATIIWILIDQSLTTTKTFNGVAVKIINIPKGKTVEGLQQNNTLNKRLSVTITGKKAILDDLSAGDFEVVVDAIGQENEWVEEISKKNLVPLNPELNFSSGIDRATSSNLIIKLSDLAKEKVPVYVTCVGEPPKPYSFLDVFPPRLTTTLQGPSDLIRRYKQKGITLTINLSQIPISALESLQSSADEKNKDLVSWRVPDEWKVVSVPLLSDQPIPIDDPKAQNLEINFLKTEVVPVNFSIPFGIYIPPDYQPIVKPQRVAINQGGIVKNDNGLKVLQAESALYAKGVSSFFLDTIRNMLEITLIFPSRFQTSSDVTWSYTFINPNLLEDRYVNAMLSSTEEDVKQLGPKIKEEIMRSRFRLYMSRLRLCDKQGNPINFETSLKGDFLHVQEKIEPVAAVKVMAGDLA